MAWWKFGLGKKSPEPEETPEVPEETPEAPEAPEPEAPAAEPEPKGSAPKRGFFGRLFGGRKKKREAVEEAPAEEAPPEGEAEAGEAAEGGPLLPLFPEEGEGGEAGAGAPSAPKPQRTYPPFLHVSADGRWVISGTVWEGTMSGTLHGSDVKTFIDAMEAETGPDYHTAIPLVADAYGIPGHLIDIDNSEIYSVTY